MKHRSHPRLRRAIRNWRNQCMVAMSLGVSLPNVAASAEPVRVAAPLQKYVHRPSTHPNASVLLALIWATSAVRRITLVPATGGGPGGGGAYEFFRPLNPDGTEITPAAGMYFNADTGEMDGSTVADQRPTFVNTVTVTVSGDEDANMVALNAALASAASSATGNTKIAIPAANYRGQLLLKTNTAGYWIGLVWVDEDTLPTPSPELSDTRGTAANRLPAATRAALPQLWAEAIFGQPEAPTVANEAGASKYYFRGLNFPNPTRVFKYYQIGILPTDPNDIATYPHHIHLVQCGGSGGDNERHWAQMCGAYLSVSDSYSADCGADGSDSQNIWFGYGPGPFKAHNNYLHCGGASENVLVGAGGPNGEAFSIQNVQITQNECDKPPTRTPRSNANPLYNSTGSNLQKNWIELKSGDKVVIQGNRGVRHNGGGQQQGIVIKLSEQNGSNLHARTRSVIIMHNWLTRGVGGIIITGWEDPNHSGPPENDFLYHAVHDIFCANNLVTPLSGDEVAGTPFASLSISTYDLYNITAIYNSVACAALRGYGGGLGIVNDSGTSSAIRVDHNVLLPCLAPAAPGPPLITGQPIGASGDAGFALLFPDANSSFVGNLTFQENHLEYYPNQIIRGTEAELGLHDYVARDISLDSDSPGYQAAPGGRDVGYQKALLDDIQSRVVLP